MDHFRQMSVETKPQITNHRPAFVAKEREVRTIRLSDHPECPNAVQVEYRSDEPRDHRVRRKRSRLNQARCLSDQTAEKSIRVLGDTRLRTKTRSHGATRRHEKSSISGKAVLKSFTLVQTDILVRFPLFRFNRPPMINSLSKSNETGFCFRQLQARYFGEQMLDYGLLPLMSRYGRQRGI